MFNCYVDDVELKFSFLLHNIAIFRWNLSTFEIIGGIMIIIGFLLFSIVLNKEEENNKDDDEEEQNGVLNIIIDDDENGINTSYTSYQRM